MKVGQYAGNDGVMKFDCEIFSCFQEKETLFYGGYTVLRIKGILQWAEGKWRHYDKFMEPINSFIRMINGLSVEKQPITTKESSQKVMKTLFCDVLRAQEWEHDGDLVFNEQTWRQNDAKTPKYIQELVLYHHSSASGVRLLYHELMNEYQWLDCIFKRKRTRVLDFDYERTISDSEMFGTPANDKVPGDFRTIRVRALSDEFHNFQKLIPTTTAETESSYKISNLVGLQDTDETDTLDIANIATLFCHSDDITFLMPEDLVLTEHQCSMLINDMKFISEMSLSVKVRFMWPSKMPSLVKSRMTNASIGLYGTDCRRIVDTKSISFITADSVFNITAQELFKSKIRMMIQKLSYQPVSVPPGGELEISSDSNGLSDKSSVSENELVPSWIAATPLSLDEESIVPTVHMLITGFLREFDRMLIWIIPSSVIHLICVFVQNEDPRKVQLFDKVLDDAVPNQLSNDSNHLFVPSKRFLSSAVANALNL